MGNQGRSVFPEQIPTAVLSTGSEGSRAAKPARLPETVGVLQAAELVQNYQVPRAPFQGEASGRKVESKKAGAIRVAMWRKGRSTDFEDRRSWLGFLPQSSSIYSRYNTLLKSYTVCKSPGEPGKMQIRTQ